MYRLFFSYQIQEKAEDSKMHLFRRLIFDSCLDHSWVTCTSCVRLACTAIAKTVIAVEQQLVELVAVGSLRFNTHAAGRVSDAVPAKMNCRSTKVFSHHREAKTETREEEVGRGGWGGGSTAVRQD